MKEEALKLADELDRMVLSDDWGDMAKYYGWFKENASPMIRKLVAELDKQGTSIWESFDKVYENCKCPSCKNKTPQTKPLSDEEIKEIITKKAHYGCIAKDDYIDFARAIEERHGIK
jgi:hypothetical protein